MIYTMKNPVALLVFSLAFITSLKVLCPTWINTPVQAAEAETPQVLSNGETFNDHRLQPLKNYNGHFPFEVPDTRKAWENRAEELRQRALISNGLWPMPPKTPLNPVIHGIEEREGFTVEKVYFEALPGFYVTGLLFRPADQSGPCPGVLSPHGHGGRLMDLGLEKVRKQIETGAEKYESSGRFPKLARCALLARMGCVVFIFDMIGYVDSVQLPRSLAHGYKSERPEMEGTDRWGFYSTQAELRLQSIMGLQTWSCIRALDFLENLPDVDPKRLAVTGGSGGGTQTILLGAIDPRPVVAFPQGMVSTAMQGGCSCENTSLLRIGTGNVELAALFAPRPQAMATANDWTRDMMTDGYPELRKLYGLYGAEEHVQCTPMPQFRHNYNYVTRGKMAEWFNHYLKLGLEAPIIEEDYVLLDDHHVWNEQHPEPEHKGDEFERSLLAQITAQSEKQIADLTPRDPESLENYRHVIGKAVETLIGRSLPNVGPIQRENVSKQNRGDYLLQTDLISISNHQEQLPVLSLYPVEQEWNGRSILWLTEKGKSGLFTEDGQLIPAVQRLLAEGNSVVSADLFAQGEFINEDIPGDRNRLVEKPYPSAVYTYTYNHTLFAQRTHDVLSLVQLLSSDPPKVQEIALVGTGAMGPVVAAAGAISKDFVASVAVESNGFRFANLLSYRDASFIPGIVKYGDMPALLALNSSHDLFVLGESEQSLPVAVSCYGINNSTVTIRPESQQAEAAISQWLLANE
ncbi:acetylxylan esterase [Calycomorphotria hydatis]|uniref:Acetyl xylan esterase (AXE1) n=1 Tax=Calycomorphotria hydatis TaxID=2528027 RepID=A0A517T8J5_9PLAN|nr:acetylxylan esterase [Calycomorphotria hydatis]QDT64686.1 Acetyl xylan esterase (AXE1) [Calycomorphotria hydatis]